jgi:glycosyltransferase involved in cell wall biosynthesis
MNIEFVGKFYDNHSLSIVNRNIAVNLYNIDGINLKITALDSYDPKFKVNKSHVKILKKLETTAISVPDIQLRHSYPPIWKWPEHSSTKIVYIQPWEFPKVPFEWQYKFETFADALIVPSKFCNSVFSNGGINPDDIFTVPNGYDPLVFNTEPSDIDLTRFGIDATAFNFVYVGNAQWRKGLDILLNAWHKSFSKYDKAKLIIKDNPGIYGRNNTLNETIKLKYKTDCADIIYIEDDLSEEEVAAIYKASKVLVHPYRAEGFAMHVQEATACGCLPIVSANGPTDDFLANEDIGIRLPTVAKPINITNPNIFALKPGDATTLMSTHTFINEPTEEHLINAMQHVYHSHNKKTLFDKVSSAKLHTWSDVVNTYALVLKEINTRKPKRNR